MVKNILSIAIIVLIMMSGVYADQLQGSVTTLRIVSVEPLGEGPYAVVSLEYPKSWADNIKFTVETGGKTVRTRKISGGFSGEKNMADLIFVPRKSGNQNITVKAAGEGKSALARSKFNWDQKPFIAIMDYTGDREILTGSDKRLTIAVANVWDVRISFNGKDVYGRLSGDDIRTLSFDPPWRQGKNVVTVSGNKFDGSIMARNFTLFYPGENGYIPSGETAVLYYGKEGSKSGPFYDIKLEGDALVSLRSIKAHRVTLDKDGWLASDTMLGKEFRAQKPGTATIKVFVKPHFLEQMKLDRELAIRVGEP